MAPKTDSKKSSSDKKSTGKRWSHKVQTESTYPPEGIFTKDAKTVARVMAKKEVSPGGLGSAIQMVQFYINRAGKNLSKERKQELEKAKHLLQEKLEKEKKE